MKIRYLSIEDRQNLRILRHSTDVELKLQLLESIFRRPLHTLQALWEYRKWFLELTEEQLRQRPALVFGLMKIYKMQGDMEKARQIGEQLSDDEPYQLLAKLHTPGIGYQAFFDLAKRYQEHGWKIPGLTLTAGRPSIINGVWDMTPYGEGLAQNKDGSMDALNVLFPEQAQVIADLTQAESLYWQDECYKALVILVSKIPLLKEKQDMRLLFVAMTLELYILVTNGQAVSVEPLIENLRHQMKYAGLEAYLPNIDALDAWAAMYDGDYANVTRWLRNAAPDEHSKFCTLDLFRYMVKMRAYIIQGKYLSVTTLCNRLLPLLEAGGRYMDTCELHIIWAMSDFADGRKEEALDHIEQALGLAEKYRYDRLLADEGQRIYELLKYYHKMRSSKEAHPYLERLISMSEKTASIHPRYLKSQLPKNPALTETEMRVLRLLADLRTNAEIAEITGMAEETAKKHCKHIFAKLEVKNRHQAVDKAIELGLIEPRKTKV